jgi:hypothetical protein
MKQRSILVGKPEGRPRCRSVNNIEMRLDDVSRDGDQRRALKNTVMTFGFNKN